MKLTVGWLESRQDRRNRPQERQEVTVDGHPGLMAWVYPSGVVVFVYRYTPPGGGGRKKMRLGQYGKGGITLAEAFDKHRQAERELELGLDPTEEQDKRDQAARLAREERAGADTVETLVEQFVHRKLRGERWNAETQQWVRDVKDKRKARKRPEAAEALLTRNLVNATLDGQVVGRIKAKELTRRQVVRLLREIVDRGAPITANRTYALMKQLFDWAAANDEIPASPMAGIERPGGDESARDRTLTREEISTFWTKLDSADMAEPTRLALKLLLITGQRRGELTLAKWAHFDFDRKVWTIPVELLKSSHSRRAKVEPHEVPLSSLALEILQKLKALTGEGAYVLPAYVDKRKHAPYSERVLSRAVRENEKHFGIPHFTPHDLRRTCRTGLSQLKVEPHIAERVIGHSLGKMVNTYDTHSFLEEKRAALDKWGEHLTAIIECRHEKVIPMVRNG